MIPIYFIKYLTKMVLQVIAIKKSVFFYLKNHLFFHYYVLNSLNY